MERTIEDAIKEYRREAERQRSFIVEGLHLEPHESHYNGVCEIKAKESEQLAEWLEELLQRRRKDATVVEQLEREKEIHTEHFNSSLYKDYPEVKRRYEQTCCVIDKTIEIINNVSKTQSQ